MRIVIAGGTGLIGQPLVERLAAVGHDIVVLSRNPDRYADQMPERVTMVRWDVMTAGKWATHVDGADTVINFAGENLAGEGFFPNRWTEEKKRRIRESRVNVANALVKAIKQAEKKPTLLLQASAVGYYGQSGDEILTESSLPGDDFLALVCIEWESTTAEVEAMGIRRVITRTGLILSTESGPLPRLLPFFRFYLGGYFGDGQQWWPWIHLEDEIRAIRFLLESETAKGPYNLTAPNPVRNREFGKTLGKVMGRPSIVPVPGFALKLALGEVAATVLVSQRVVPRKLEELGFTFQFEELEPALRDTLES